MLATAEWLDYIWAIVGVAISCLAPPGIAILVNWLKKVKFVKNWQSFFKTFSLT